MKLPKQVPSLLTDDQKRDVRAILSVGCDRQTAADYVGCSLGDLRRVMQHDTAFRTSIRRAEASVELSHMRNVQETAKNKNDWRASVWWLERRSPERFGRRSAGAITARQLQAFVAILVDALKEDVRSEEDRSRIITRLKTIADSANQLLLDARSGQTDVGDSVNSLVQEAAGCGPFESLAEEGRFNQKD